MKSHRSALSLAMVVVVVIGWAECDQVGFINEAEATINEVTKVLHIEDCINAAKAKANSLGHTSGEMHYAVTWISMYSRICLINETLLSQDKNINSFPFRLNKELRCAFHQERDSKIKKTFKRAAQVISASLSIIGFKKVNILFRGVTTFEYRHLAYFTEYGFFSASISPSVALRFANGSTLLIIRAMNGVPIAKFVQEMFNYQKEVLAPPEYTFSIGNITTDKVAISYVLKPYTLWKDVKLPTEIIYLTYIPGAMKQARPDFMTNYCSAGITSQTNRGEKPSFASTTIMQITTIFYFTVSQMVMR
ncbi:hypothetical protein MAR_023019 [Mya arenaria]|uniref:NAD(P)(+)--arginine ADP-ribosyltransferase n=1 Tax=Mya arenaria TaxID=6604 RepID=A0ABY7DPY9_MYAAR|nr:uncharacterized protein LOC128227918 isoform X1 [Mya arenaria]XP_052794820.1 uncharacterized protein LOC128227918 isoform X1 [Mya arenaria]WAQ98646.1 hypothetical protein MAR_023019 [Mya arenaria]